MNIVKSGMEISYWFIGVLSNFVLDLLVYQVR